MTSLGNALHEILEGEPLTRTGQVPAAARDLAQRACWLREEGLSYRAIALELGCSHPTVMKYVRMTEPDLAA